jgi:DNA-binding FadR family transcriptional regulator
VRKADHIANALLGRIVAGEIPPGSLLPKESDLAARFGVNRSVVREAVKKLEADRLVRPIRRRGTLVLDPIASLSPAVLRAMLVPAGQRVDPRMLAHILEVRAGIDVEMNGLAALRRTEDDLSRLDERAAALEAAAGRPREYARLVDGLVLAIARATQNPIYEMLVHWHAEVTQDLEDLFFLVRLPSEPHMQGVRHLVGAIRARDAALARAIAETFHRWATPRLLEAVGAVPKEVA